MENEIDKLKQDLKSFNMAYIARLVGISNMTLSSFMTGRHILSAKNYLKVRNALDKIAKNILGE